MNAKSLKGEHLAMAKSIVAGAALILLVFFITGCAPSNGGNKAGDTVKPPEEKEMLPKEETEEMILQSAGITDGVIDPKYGANGSVKQKGIPVLSLPLKITGAPEETAAFAVSMDDPDAMPIAGYRWVHWMAVNLRESDIPEDFSRQAGAKAVQGKNDFNMTGYGGPTPPDKDHTYVIKVYALDALLSLKEGFSKEEFSKALKGHVLAEATLNGVYKK